MEGGYMGKLSVGSMPGGIAIAFTKQRMGWKTVRLTAAEYSNWLSSAKIHVPSRIWGGAVHASGGTSVHVPFWYTILFSAILAASPWLRYFTWRFSLRTLLIATTLVAVVLGTGSVAVASGLRQVWTNKELIEIAADFDCGRC
jgi:hypothetical protein